MIGASGVIRAVLEVQEQYVHISLVGAGGCLRLVIGLPGIDQGGAGGPRKPPLGRAWLEDHFYV